MSYSGTYDIIIDQKIVEKISFFDIKNLNDLLNHLQIVN